MKTIHLYGIGFILGILVLTGCNPGSPESGGGPQTCLQKSNWLAGTPSKNELEQVRNFAMAALECKATEKQVAEYVSSLPSENSPEHILAPVQSTSSEKRGGS